jgi:hypothetical protein
MVSDMLEAAHSEDETELKGAAGIAYIGELLATICSE